MFEKGKKSEFCLHKSKVLDWGDYNNVWDNLGLLYFKDLIKYYCVHQAQIFGNENIEKLANKFGLKPELFPRYIGTVNFST